MNGVGFIQSVRNQEKKAGGFFQVAMVQMDGMESPYNMAYFGSLDIHSAANKRVEVEWAEEQRGQYVNRSIKTFKVLPASLQPTSPAPLPGASTGGVVTVPSDPKQENINRQSAFNQAVNLVSAALAAGYNVVPGDSAKAKKAAKDPEVLFEWVTYYARRIKALVQRGEWEVIPEETEEVSDELGCRQDDLPF